MGFANRFERLSTGIKIFSLITLALLPLGIIALVASLAAARTADSQRIANMRVGLTESTHRLRVELAADTMAMRRAGRAAAVDSTDDEACSRLMSVFAARAQRKSQFALFGIGNAPICATPGFLPRRPSTLALDSAAKAVINRDSLDIVVYEPRSGGIVVVRYPATALAAFSQPVSLTGSFGSTLSTGQSKLPLRLMVLDSLVGTETISAPVGIFGLSLSISTVGARFGTTAALLTFLPLLMWASAALIGFIVVDRLLIRPLRSLRLAVASHVPGTKFQVPPMRTPAREIRELGETFAKFGDEIALHEQQMALALADQTRATREVHHRVKNNLQVIASLISLHARGASAPDAVTAYATIQRRVDALSIVHRNHYADRDPAEGIDVKALLAELAANLRASAAMPAVPAISIYAAPFGISQDNAVAIAFLITELVELSMVIGTADEIAITVIESNTAMKARLTVASCALMATPAMIDRLSLRYARVLEGLSRQLRAPLTHCGKSGRFDIEIAVLRLPV